MNNENYNEFELIAYYLRFIAAKLKGDDYKEKLIKSLDGESEERLKNIAKACFNVAVELGHDSLVLANLDEKLNNRNKLRKKYRNGLLRRTDAISYSGLPESSFDKVVDKKKIKEYHNGTLMFRISNLDQIARFILDSSKKAMCTCTCVFHDKKRNKKMKYEAGFAYTIIDEDEKGVSFYDEETKQQLKLRMQNSH